MHKGYPTFGAYIRSKNIKVAYCKSHKGQDYSAEKKWDKDLAEYAKVRSQGIQPDSTNRKDVEEAKILSDTFGSPYGEGFLGG